MKPRRPARAGLELRHRLAAEYRQLAEAYYPGAGGSRVDPGGWLRKAAELERGDAVVVPTWIVARHAPEVPASVEWVRVAPDGTMAAVVPVLDDAPFVSRSGVTLSGGRIVGWEPA